jgi:hypothetical protein
MLGKEWWISHDWGLGLALQVYGGSMDDQNDGETWTVGAFSIAASFTYN